MAEVGPIWLWSAQRSLGLVKATTGIDELSAAYRNNQGVLIMVPHLGCWEIVGIYLSSIGLVTAMYRPPKMKELAPIIKQGREKLGANLVPTNLQGVRELYKALDKQHLVCFLLPARRCFGNDLARIVGFFHIDPNG